MRCSGKEKFYLSKRYAHVVAWAWLDKALQEQSAMWLRWKQVALETGRVMRQQGFSKWTDTDHLVKTLPGISECSKKAATKVEQCHG